MMITAMDEKEEKRIRKQKLYMLILTALQEHGELTAREASVILFEQGAVATPTRQEAAPRMCELCERGQIEVCGTKIDSQTLKRVSVYRITEDSSGVA